MTALRIVDMIERSQTTALWFDAGLDALHAPGGVGAQAALTRAAG